MRLQVAAARQEESGQGIARLPRSAFQEPGITEGDVIEITGKRSTPAIAMAAYAEDVSLDVIRLDGLQRGNAEVGSGEHVRIVVAESRPATRVVFAPAQREMRLQGPGQALLQQMPVVDHGARSMRRIPACPCSNLDTQRHIQCHGRPSGFSHDPLNHG